jgi:hypothetical protein
MCLPWNVPSPILWYQNCVSFNQQNNNTSLELWLRLSTSLLTYRSVHLQLSNAGIFSCYLDCQWCGSYAIVIRVRRSRREVHDSQRLFMGHRWKPLQRSHTSVRSITDSNRTWHTRHPALAASGKSSRRIPEQFFVLARFANPQVLAELAGSIAAWRWEITLILPTWQFIEPSRRIGRPLTRKILVCYS